jgi:release factor glutamine methyltransferase
MKVDDWLRRSGHKLQQAGIGTARLDALVLLEDVTKVARAKLLAEPERELAAAKLAKLQKLLNMRVQHVPLAYVRGKTEFYGREFVISPAVLEPRPESETMIDMLKALPDLPPKPCMADVGAGSGALGITAKLELPQLAVDLLEVDSKALKVTRTNVDKFTLKLNVVKSDLLDSAEGKYDVLLCNLPYVPDDYQINTAAVHEPRLAIFGGPDGLDVYRKLFEQLNSLPWRPLYLLLEALPPQHAALQAIATKAGYELVEINDFIQLFRRAQ